MNEKRLLLATTNRGKIREIRKLLRGLGFKLENLSDHPEFGTFVERGKTFEENSRGKSLFYSRRYPGLVLAEDSGLEVEALEGKPGVRSARFAGPGATDTQNINKLLRLLRNIPPARRKARFVCVITLARNGRVIKSFKGQVRGRITETPRGNGGFGYDPVFYYPPLKKTFAQLKAGEKNAVSHRGRALRKLRQFLEKFRTIPADGVKDRSGPARNRKSKFTCRRAAANNS